MMKLNSNIYQELAQKALEARQMSYSPYSHFQVGAALLDVNGNIYTGCNIENAAYTPSNCAERTAVFKAVSDGSQKFVAIAIAGGSEGAKLPLAVCPPCGVCRQVLREFTDPKTFEIVLVQTQEKYRIFLLEDLLPESFGPESLS